jgi:hypothetical protein
VARPRPQLARQGRLTTVGTNLGALPKEAFLHRAHLSACRRLRAGLLRAGGAGGALRHLCRRGRRPGEALPLPRRPVPRRRRRGGALHGTAQKGTWTFNLDVGLGAFGFANSLYTNVRPDPSGDLSDNWAESYAKPSISGHFGLGRSELYGKVSAVGERTYAAPPPLVGEEASSFKIEDLSLGWRSGKSLGTSENLLDFTVGRTPYTIGHGLLLWDGAGEGQPRRLLEQRAQGLGVRGRRPIETGETCLRGLLPRSRRGPESDTGTQAVGRELRLTLSESSTFGASYLKFHAGPEARARPRRPERLQRAGVHHPRPDPARPFLRARIREGGQRRPAPLRCLHRPCGLRDGQGGLEPQAVLPLCVLQGRRPPPTTANEGFDALLPGFFDWGTWWQGEIAGEYFLSNST